MSILKLSLALLLFVGLFSCEEGFDDISTVSPGPDELAPSVSISYPLNGTIIRVVEDVTNINIRFQVEDDIEIQTVTISLDGNQIANYSSFVDYRRFLETYSYTQLTNGEHELSIVATDMSGKTTTETVNFIKDAPYKPVFDGETFYMPFDNDYVDLISLQEASITGNPSFSGESAIEGDGLNSYKGNTGSYLTMPTSTFLQPGQNDFSVAFWYKSNSNPDRAGVLVIGPPDETNPSSANNRTKGFRLFRENAGGMQRIKLNIGTGTTEKWYDGGAAADLEPGTDDWVHIAFSISDSFATVFINGVIVSSGDFTGINFENCDVLSIMSGAPRFVGWSHLADQSIMDELRLFDKSLSQQEVQEIMNY